MIRMYMMIGKPKENLWNYDTPSKSVLHMSCSTYYMGIVFVKMEKADMF